jgi:hypothetical protein
VGKQVALYLARVAPRAAIHALAAELATAADFPDPDGDAIDDGWDDEEAVILEFHHPPRDWEEDEEEKGGGNGGQAAAATGVGQGEAPRTGRAGAFSPSARALVATPSALAAAIKRTTLGVISGHKVGGTGGGGMLSFARRASAPAAATQRDRDRAGSPSSSARPSMEVAPARTPRPARTALTRPEAALCLLAELACEHDEEFRPHLAPVLHACVVFADSRAPAVRRESAQLLQTALYSLACKHLEAQGAGAGASAEHARVSSVIVRLQALEGEPLWPREAPGLARPWTPSAGYLTSFVQTGELVQPDI